MERDFDDDVLADASLAEIEKKIAKYEALPSEHQRSGGANLETSLVVSIFAALGLLASMMLVISEFDYLRNPSNPLLCDVNPLIGCSTWFDLWQGHLIFGIPNAIFGIAFFAGMVGLGLVLLFGGKLPRLVWQLGTVGVVIGIAWVGWFSYQSFFVEGSLCPYCIVVWLSFWPLAVHYLARALQAGHVGAGLKKLGSSLVRGRWLIVAIGYGAFVLFTLFWFWDSWVAMF